MNALLARLATWCAERLFVGLVDAWKAWRARRDAVQIGRDEVVADALGKAVAREREMAEEALAPPARDVVADRLRDGSF